MDNKEIDGLSPHQGADNAAEGQRELAEHARASARRRFIKGGAAVTPVLLSLVSRPVMGTSRRYCSASGFMSGNLSRPNSSQSCGGCSPDYWKNYSSWPSPYKCGSKNNNNYSGGTKFHDVFAKGKYNYGTKCMLEVLWTEPGSFACDTIACLMNAGSGVSGYSMNTTQVVKIWNDIMGSGVYMITDGNQMYEPDAKVFFENTYS